MEKERRIVYNGERFREFLVRNRITYQDASEKLGIDKNTIGKAVRGGNLNTSILLKICNEYKLNLSDFFSVVSGGNDASKEPEVGEREYFIGNPNILTASESGPVYNLSPTSKTVKFLEDLIRSKDTEINRLRMLIKLYEERVDTLQRNLFNRE